MRTVKDSALRMLRLAALAGLTTQTLWRTCPFRKHCLFMAMAEWLGSVRFWMQHDPDQNKIIGKICTATKVRCAVARFLARSMVSRDSLFANNKSFLMFRVAVRLCCQSPVVLYALADAVTNKRHMDYWALQYAAANVHVLCLRSVAIVAHYPIASATRSTPPMLGYALFQLRRRCRHMRPNTARQTAMIHLLTHLKPPASRRRRRVV
jgi:hypothetical protein